MLSSELSALAGVSIRALRHYHKVGVLDEPPRTAAGYRQYGVRDLIRLLRIKRLAALGIALEQMPPLLDQTDDDSAVVLNQLDHELAAQIDQLTCQRHLIAQLQAQNTPPDLPPELSLHLAEFTRPNASRILSRIDRDLSVLFAHFVKPAGMAPIAEAYRQLNSPAILPVVVELNDRFENLSADTPQDQVDVFVDDYVEALAPLIRGIPLTEQPIDSGGLTGVFDLYTSEILNCAQRRAIELVIERFSDREIPDSR